MLEQQVFDSLRFFDLQDCPLTLFELYKFLLPTRGQLCSFLNEKWEYKEKAPNREFYKASLDKILQILENNPQVESHAGYYCLKGRKQIISDRLQNYFYGIKREKLIRRFAPFVKHLPFVRGVALLGSQALGQQRPNSDIDLLIVVDSKFLWLTRLLVSVYFQLTGHRRHGKKAANRFCLNHYLGDNSALSQDRNLYTASEYLKMRPLVYPQSSEKFLKLNREWILSFFPNGQTEIFGCENQSFWQQTAEKILRGAFGLRLESFAKKLQIKKINAGAFIAISDNELSFHPNNRKLQLFERFFELQK